MSDSSTMDPWKEAKRIRTYSPRPERELAFNSLVMLQALMELAGFQVIELDMAILGNSAGESAERFQKVSALVSEAMASVGKVIDFLDDENDKTKVNR